MLVLTRKLRDQIKIGNDITITVLKIKGNSVRIGIDAPQDVHILRGELPQFDDAPIDADASDEETTFRFEATVAESDDDASISESLRPSMTPLPPRTQIPEASRRVDMNSDSMRVIVARRLRERRGNLLPR